MVPCLSQGQLKGTFTLPNSILLSETLESSLPGVPYYELLIVSAAGTVVVQSPSGLWGQGGRVAALAPGAERVAWSLGYTMHLNQRD
jgi:hypothetical protein